MNEAATTDRDYFERYYKTHKESISERRKQLYRDNEEYRLQCIERAKARYQEKREEIREKNRKSPHVVWPDGRQEAAFHLSDFAEGIGKRPFTVRKWIRDGVIPDSPIKRSGIRFYTQRMIDVARKALPQTFRKDWEKVRSKIQRGWEKARAFDPGAQVESL